MPKLKSRKAAVKRFKITKSGKIMRYKAGKKHIMEHKSSRVKREMCASIQVDRSDMKRLRKTLQI